MNDERVFVLIGRMLGASLPWAQGTVTVTHDDDQHTERFWQLRGRIWRVERSDGLTFIEREGIASRVLFADGRSESGPSAGVGRFAAGQLLRPASAPVWGRPGEDWRLAGTLEQAGEGRWRLPLVHVEGGYPHGHLVVDEVSGILHELALRPGVMIKLDFLETVNVDEINEEDLLR